VNELKKIDVDKIEADARYDTTRACKCVSFTIVVFSPEFYLGYFILGSLSGPELLAWGLSP
jgi:hypothetical protein